MRAHFQTFSVGGRGAGLVVAAGEDAPHQPLERAALLDDVGIPQGVGVGGVLVHYVCWFLEKRVANGLDGELVRI